MLKFQPSETGFWEVYPGDPDVRIKIRPITKSIIRRIAKKATITKMERENGRMTAKEVVDNEQMESLLLDHMVEDWEGIESVDGAKIPVTPDSKTEIMDRYLQLSGWLNEIAFSLGEKIDQEVQKKNTN